MSFNLAQAASGWLTQSVVEKGAAAIGENPNKTRAAMSTGVLATIAGLINVGSSKGGAASLLSRLRSDDTQRLISRDDELEKGIQPQNLGSRGETLATSLFGDKSSNLTDIVARSSGVSRKGAGTIMGMIVPVVTGYLAREAISKKLDAGGLSSLLLDQKKSLLGSPLPSGLAGMLVGEGERITSLEEVNVVSAQRDVAIADAPRIREEIRTVPAKKFPWGILLGAAALGALLIAGALLVTGRRDRLPHAEAPVVTEPHIARPEVPRTDVPPVVPLPHDEPTSETTTTGAGIDKDTDKSGDGLSEHVNFLFATTTVVEGDDGAVDRIADYLKEHPAAKLRLEGHTDSVGNADVNVPLSYQRAMKVRSMLIERGIGSDRIEAVGKRDLAPVAGNDTKEGRAENRRVEAIVIEE